MNTNKTTLSNCLLILVSTLLLSIIVSTNFFGSSRDYTDYLNYYNSTRNLIGKDEFRFPTGFYFLVSAFSKNNISFTSFIFVLTFISLVLKFYIISKNNSKLFFWFIAYFFIILPLHEYTQIRISIAIAFLYLSFYFFVSKNFILSWILLIINPFIHLGILFFYPVFFVFLICSKKTRLLSLLPALILFALGYFLLNTEIYNRIYNRIDYFSNYYFTANDQGADIFSIRFLSFALILVCGLFFSKNFPYEKKIWFIFSIFGVFYYLIFNSFAILSYRLFEISLLSFFMWVDFLPPSLRFFSKNLITLNIFLSVNNFFLSSFLGEYPL